MRVNDQHALQIFFLHLILTKTLGGTYCYPHFTEEEIETKKGCGYPRVLSEFELRPSNYAACKCTKTYSQTHCKTSR